MRNLVALTNPVGLPGDRVEGEEASRRLGGNPGSI